MKETTEEKRVVPGPGLSDAEEGRLLRENEGLVQKVARSVVGDTHLLEDALQEGRMAMINLTRKFDASRGVPWSGYVSQGMRFEIIRWVANQGNAVRVPVHAYQKGRRAPMVSVDAPLCSDGDNGFSLLDTLAAPEGEHRLGDDPEQVARLWAAVDGLPEKMRRVIRWRFGEAKLTLEEAGEQLGVTGERIRQIEAKAVERLSWALREAVSARNGAVLAAAKERAKGMCPQRSLKKPGGAERTCPQAPATVEDGNEPLWLRRARKRSFVVARTPEPESEPEPKILNSTKETETMSETLMMPTTSPQVRDVAEDDDFRPMGIVAGWSMECDVVNYSVRMRSKDRYEVRFGIGSERIRKAGFVKGDFLRLDVAMKRGQCRLVKVGEAVPGIQKLKITRPTTGRGELVVTWRGEIEECLPDTKGAPMPLAVVCCDEARGLVFELPGRSER
jgi:RNA polymerase sigma factor (sigma-70 family)